MAKLSFKDQLVALLRSEAVKALLLQFIGHTAGFKAWFLSFVLGYAFNLIVKPVLLMSFRKGYRVIETVEGHLQIRRLESAEDKKAYRDALSNIFE